MSSRRKYSQEYEREAVQIVQSGDVAISQVGRELGINANMLGRWCRERAPRDAPTSLTTSSGSITPAGDASWNHSSSRNYSLLNRPWRWGRTRRRSEGSGDSTATTTSRKASD
jgi:hypothetical protein